MALAKRLALLFTIAILVLGDTRNFMPRGIKWNPSGKHFGLEWRFRVPIGNNGAMHFTGYPEAYNHAHSLHVYFWHIWVPCIPVRTRNCVNTLIHILYNFQTIWVQCISMHTQNCIHHITSHHIETTDAGLDGLCIREINVYHTTL